MGLKYQIEYPDVKGVAHRVEIYDDSYSAKILKPNGVVFFDYAETDDPLEPIRGAGLRIELDADETFDFSDLYSEEQQTFKVIYKRNLVTLFTGWVNPEGWYEDFVNNKWKVSFDCVDGLSFLKDLSFVDNDTGAPFTGTTTQLDIIATALLRTGLEQNINVDIQIYYTGLSTGCILENVYARLNRYIRDDKGTIMSCEEVIKDVIEPYGACLTSHEGEWYIYKPNQIFSSKTMTWHRYSYLGISLLPETKTFDIDFALGSETDDFYPHHCSGNQSISFKNSIAIFRINYKYGDSKSLIGNSYFEGTNPLTDWTTLNTLISTDVGDAVGLEFNNPGVTFSGPLATVNPVRTAMLSTEIVGITTEDLIKYRYKAICDLPSGVEWQMNWRYAVYSTTAADGNPIYMNGAGQWTNSSPRTINTTFRGGEITIELAMDAPPQDGKIKLILYSAETEDFGGGLPPVGFKIKLTEFSFERSEENTNPLEGEFHTVQRIDKPSRQVKDVKEVYTGDSATDLYIGTLYKADGNTPTTSWYRTGVTEVKPILQIMGEETLRLSASISRVFSGDVYGYFSYLSRVTINNFTGLIFMPVKYSYDTKNNIISAEFRQIYGSELTDDIDYKLTYDYGTTVKPTILT